MGTSILQRSSLVIQETSMSSEAMNVLRRSNYSDIGRTILFEKFGSSLKTKIYLKIYFKKESYFHLDWQFELF